MTALMLDRVSIRHAGADTGTDTKAELLSEVTLQLEHGQIGCLLGPSGCGKSTLLRAIAGFERVGAGLIRSKGQVLSGPGVHVAPEHRGIGMMFQEIALFPHLSAAHNIAFGLRRRSREERNTRVHAMLALVGLQGLGERMPHQLSGGQQQRVALARSLAPSPGVLLLDEPFSSLDPSLRASLANDVSRILREAGQTALMVTHDNEEATAIGDKVWHIQDGRVSDLAQARGQQAQEVSVSVRTISS